MTAFSWPDFFLGAATAAAVFAYAVSRSTLRQIDRRTRARLRSILTHRSAR